MCLFTGALNNKIQWWISLPLYQIKYFISNKWYSKVSVITVMWYGKKSIISFCTCSLAKNSTKMELPQASKLKKKEETKTKPLYQT